MPKAKTDEEKEETISCMLGRGKGNCTTVNIQSCHSCGFNPDEYARRRRWINRGRGLELNEKGKLQLNLKGRQR